jgi:hypothetical protein
MGGVSQFDDRAVPWELGALSIWEAQLCRGAVVDPDRGTYTECDRVTREIAAEAAAPASAIARAWISFAAHCSACPIDPWPTISASSRD